MPVMRKKQQQGRSGRCQWAGRLKAYRAKLGLTQEALALRWSVSSRSIARWERGEGRPTEWMRQEIAAIENPLEWPSMSVIRDLIENRNTPGMLLTEKLVVLTATPVHKRWVQEVHGVDIAGVDWHRFTSDSALAMFEQGGGMPHMIRNGLMCIRGFYRDPGGSADGDIPEEMYIDLTVLRIPDYGNVCLAVSRQPTPSDRLEPLRPYFMD